MNSRISVLLVDDNRFVRESLCAWFEDDGFAVHSAVCGEEARQLFATTSIDLALIDLTLPDMSGEELIVQLIKNHPESHFLIHTGTHSYRLSLELQNLGMQDDDIIYKPAVSLTLLTDMIRRKVRGTAHVS